MKISYKPLWKTLIDRDMSKRQLRLQAHLTTNHIANMGKGEHISMATLVKICEALNCDITDAVSYTHLYYTAYGMQGIFTVLLFAVCFIYYNYNFAKAGAEEHFEKGNDVYKFYCGKYVGTFMDYYSTIFCYMSFFVMVGGAASTLNQQYGLPSWVGGVVLTCLLYTSRCV